VADKLIHFGYFVRYHRVRRGEGPSDFAAKIGISATRLHAIEKMPEPMVRLGTLRRLAQALGYAYIDELDAAWRQTKVDRPKLQQDRTGRSVPDFTLFDRNGRYYVAIPAETALELRNLARHDQDRLREILRTMFVRRPPAA